jgi:hypothetical protein
MSSQSAVERENAMRQPNPSYWFYLRYADFAVTSDREFTRSNDGGAFCIRVGQIITSGRWKGPEVVGLGLVRLLRRWADQSLK